VETPRAITTCTSTLRGLQLKDLNQTVGLQKKSFCLLPRRIYSSIPGHRNWQIETAVCNLAGFLHCALEPRWQRFGQFLKDLLRDFMLDFRKIASEIQKKHAILVENPRHKSRKIESEIQDKISYYKARDSTGGVETRWLWWQFLNGS